MSFDDYIFYTPSFFRGVARSLDIGGGLSREALLFSRDTADADARALASDWRIVNRDLNYALAHIVEVKEKPSAAREHVAK